MVAYENRVVMEETLEEGLGRIFGGATGGAAAPAGPAEPGRPATAAETGAAPAVPEGAAPAPTEAPRGDLARRARAHYERAMAAQRAGDWARYGEEIRRLGEVLQEMAESGGAGGEPER